MQSAMLVSSHIILAVVVFIISRAIIRFMHMHGFYPERRLSRFLFIAKRYIRAPLPPRVADAPGLVWRRDRGRWEALWKPSERYVDRGFPPKEVKLLKTEAMTVTDIEAQFISELCVALQHGMLEFPCRKAA